MREQSQLKVPWIIASNFTAKVLRQRTLIRNMVARDLKSRYVGSVMGLFWSVIHPLVLLASYSFVFSVIFDLKPWPEMGTGSFALYLFCSILPWLFFQDTLTRSCTVVIENARLIRKTIFPTEMLPVAVLLANLVNHLIGFAVLLAILVLARKVSWMVLFVPVYLAALSLFTLGLGWVLSSLNVFVRDTAQVLSVVLTFWFWLTPIFYTEEWVPERFWALLKLNPLAYVVIGYRDCLLRQRPPQVESLALLFLFALSAFILGGIFFRLTKREFVDVI